jgi:hypothetical protein
MKRALHRLPGSAIFVGGRWSELKSSNLDNFEHIHYYLYSSRFWLTVVNRATNNQANQSCINTACTVPNRSACSKDAWPWRGTEECSNVGCLMELCEDVFQNSLFFARSKLAWAHI